MYGSHTHHTASGLGRSGKGRPANMSPDDVRFTHDVISRRFRVENRDELGAPPDGPMLEETFEKLVRNEISVSNLPRILVVIVNGQYWAINGNRRLYVYKKLKEFGLIENIPVRIVPLNEERFSQANTTKTDGKSVRVQGISDREYHKIFVQIYQRVQNDRLAYRSGYQSAGTSSWAASTGSRYDDRVNEYHPRREPNIADGLLNLIGAVIGGVVHGVGTFITWLFRN